MGSPGMLLLVGFISTLITLSCAIPYQCHDLQKAVPDCICEARVFRNIVLNDQVVINCRNINISTVPTIRTSSDHVIYEMTLAMNNIQTIPAAAFNGLQIQHLDLRKNRLTTIDQRAFQGLENVLKELYLGADNGANIEPPIDALRNLSALNSLTLENFKYPNNRLFKGTLNHLSNLRTLTLNHNDLTYIEPLALPTGLTSLTLNNQELSSFPVDLLRSLVSLQNLTITNTQIPALYGDALELNTQLATLDLGYNQINTLSNGCFNGITDSLISLSLQNNPIPTASILNEIKQLTALQTLQLSDITLRTLPPAADFLINKNSLRVLHLQGNGITTLGPDSFSTLGALEELNLGYNQLAGMDNDVFNGLSSLRYLDLGHQQTSQTQKLALPTSLKSLTSLETLKLTRTTLDQAMLWPIIGSLTSLKVLKMDSTTTTSLPDYALRDLTQLSELNLDNNGLSNITQEMMAGPRNLAKLMLNKNGITSINNCVFYGFTLSPALSLELMENPLHCDCKLRWLLERRDANTIELAGVETCASPALKAGQPLSSFVPADFTCASSEPDSPCLELYTTTDPPTTSTTPIADLGVAVTNVSTTTIDIQWIVMNIPNLSHFKVQTEDPETLDQTISEEIGLTDRNFTVTGLKPGTAYIVCVNAFDSSQNSLQRTCVQRTTESNGETGELGDDGSSSDVGIIVGTVFGALALLALLAAIFYFVCLRRRDSKELPTQPHVFTASELPGIGATSRQFIRPKEKEPPKVGRAMDENIKVTVISDGQTQPVSPRDRQSVGSYQFLDEKHPNPNPDIVPPNSDHYSNDVNSRPLPSAPENSLKGYYNGGFGQETSPHIYNQPNE